MSQNMSGFKPKGGKKNAAGVLPVQADIPAAD